MVADQESRRIIIKYYQLAKDEELPDEFCAVKDVGGEPSEYTFYVPESEVIKLLKRITTQKQTIQAYRDELRKLGVEVD